MGDFHIAEKDGAVLAREGGMDGNLVAAVECFLVFWVRFRARM